MKKRSKNINENFQGSTKKETEALKGVIHSLENSRRIETLKVSWAYKGAVIVLFILFLCVLGLLAWQMLRPKNEIAYVVEVNTTTGEQRVINGVVSEIGQYTMSEYLILNSIKTYITNLRSVSNDNGVNRTRINNVYAFSTEQASQYISDYFSEHNPIDRGSAEYVEVVIYNCTPINNSNSDYLKFLVDWNEITRSTSGRIVSEKNYRADIDAKQFKVTKLTSDLNPIGLYVCHINISEIKNGYLVNPN